jgi:hypothetical protein
VLSALGALLSAHPPLDHAAVTFFRNCLVGYFALILS